MSRSIRFIALGARRLGRRARGEPRADPRRRGDRVRPPRRRAGTALPPVVATEFAPIEPVAAAALPPILSAASLCAGAARLSGPLRRSRRVRGGGVARRPPCFAPPPRFIGARVRTRPRGTARPRRDALCRKPAPARAMAARRRGARARRARARRAQSTPAEMIRAIPGIDRLSMSAWAMMRRDPGSPSLATNGQLGGSQAGRGCCGASTGASRPACARARRSAGSSATPSSPPGCAGSRHPNPRRADRRAPPVFGRDKGASAFALFAEGGVYDRPIIAGFNLDAYLQAGVVGVRDHAASSRVGDPDPPGVAPVQRRVRGVGRGPAGACAARRRAARQPSPRPLDAHPPRLSPPLRRPGGAGVGPGADPRRRFLARTGEVLGGLAAPLFFASFEPMDIYLPIAGLSVNALLIVALGGLVGILSGMFGVGGGFLTTPLLIFYGIPPAVAVASATTQITGSSVRACSPIRAAAGSTSGWAR